MSSPNRVSFLEVSPPKMIDEGLDPMSNVLEEAAPGQMAPRNMSSWVARAAETIIGGTYKTQDAALAAKDLQSQMMKYAAVQTEPPEMKDASAMIIDGAMESERLNDLNAKIPVPAELPVLTTSQLLEMERRLGDLISRFEDEVMRAEAEIKRRREQEAEIEKREAVMSSNRFGKWNTNDEWALQMRNRVELRLHKRHGFADVPSLPTQKANLDSTLRSPLRRKYQNQQQQSSQQRGVTPTQGGGLIGLENSSRSSGGSTPSSQAAAMGQFGSNPSLNISGGLSRSITPTSNQQGADPFSF